MASVKVGSQVRYKVGLGYGSATVSAIDGDKAVLNTNKGGQIRRRLDSLQSA